MQTSHRLPVHLALSLFTGICIALITASHLKPQLVPTFEERGTLPALQQFPIHSNITATMFWVGEPASEDNQNISNLASAWDENWIADYGGADLPTGRCGYQPCIFMPKENTFYFALPFNDYDSSGTLKPITILRQIPWFSGPPSPHQSLVKNHWIAVTYGNKTVYGQWEDVGPLGENDVNYVFGNAQPQASSGLDLSPAMNDYLQLHGQGKVSWRFIPAPALPDGPWRRTITTRGTDY